MQRRKNVQNKMSEHEQVSYLGPCNTVMSGMMGDTFSMQMTCCLMMVRWSSCIQRMTWILLMWMPRVKVRGMVLEGNRNSVQMFVDGEKGVKLGKII